MTIQEFKNIVKKENNQIVVTQDDKRDVYVIDSDKMDVLSWICGKDPNHFTVYSGLSDRRSWNAINDFAETLPNDRGLSQQAN